MVQQTTKKGIQESNEYKELDNYTATSIAEGFDGGEDATDEQKQAFLNQNFCNISIS